MISPVELSSANDDHYWRAAANECAHADVYASFFYEWVRRRHYKKLQNKQDAENSCNYTDYDQ